MSAGRTKNSGGLVKTFVPVLLLFAIVLFAGTSLRAQTTDFSGEWANRCTEDYIARCGMGEQLGDYLGIPLNAEGRMRVETSDVAEWGLPEFQCRTQPSAYQARSAGKLRITKEVNALPSVL